MKLYTKRQMNQIDLKASEIYKIPTLILMEHAASGIFFHMQKEVHKNQTILIVCGSGNNGGDGFALARMLYLSHYQVSIMMLSEKESLSKDAKINYDICIAMKIKFVNHIEKVDVVVDGIFGTGLSREVDGKYRDVIEKINALNAYVISIDIPSGIKCDSGELLGCAIKANITYTLQKDKIGLHIYPGRAYANKVVICDLGVPSALMDELSTSIFLIEKKEMKTLLPLRSMHSNKGSYGKLLCIGGSEGMSGAISLASKSALKVGCGLLTCAIPKGIIDVIHTNVLEGMSISLPQNDDHISKDGVQQINEVINQYTCVLIGCGITRSKEIESIIKCCLDSETPCIIDADALYHFASFIDLYAHRKDIIITPHLKEFSRLIQVDIKEIVEHTLKYVHMFSEKYPNITLVLKSETTFIAKDGQVYLNNYGNNGLAVGGSGDVLAGMIAGFYAQNRNTLNASILGVFFHAYSADKLLNKKSVYSITPSDVIEEVECIIKEVEGEE